MDKADYQKWANLLAVPAMFLFCALICLAGIKLVNFVPTATKTADQLPILIDPGHGGADGGASGPDGTMEKDLNLAIALPLRDMLKLLGYPVNITRETDCSLHSPWADSIREIKVSDLQNRLALYNESGLVISIHQNKFGQSQYFGTQVFYGLRNPESSKLGEAIRSSVIGMLQPDNTRELKKSYKSVYLLSHAEPPAVIVECGFLSNPQELEKLKTPEYQRQMAFSIMAGLLSYYANRQPAAE